MAGPSTDFERFLESFHSPRSDRRFADDFHLGAIGRLQRGERERAERLLIQRLRGRPFDDRVPSALATLKSTDAIEPLREALDDTSGFDRLRVAVALDELDPDYDPVDVLRDSLTSSDPSARSLASGQLAKQPRDKAREPLLDALDDPSFAVRAAAFEALVKLYDLGDLKAPTYSRLRAAGWRLLSDEPSVYNTAVSEVRAVIPQLDAGRTPAYLGLERQPGDPAAVDRIIASLQHGPKPPFADDLDLEAVASTDAATRHVVECYLLAELHTAARDGDSRPAGALAAIGSKLAAQPLKSVVESSKGKVRAQAALALERVAGDGSGRRVLKQLSEDHGDTAAQQALVELDSSAG